MELKTQKCPRCKTLRKPSQFIFNEKEHKTCIVCAEKAKENYKKNKDKILVKNKKYYEDNIDKVKAYQKKYYEDNPDKVKAYQKKYYEDNTDKAKEQAIKYYEDNTDKAKEQATKYRENQKETNPLQTKFKIMITSNKKNDKSKNIYDEEHHIDMDYLNRLHEVQDGLCIYCKCLMELDFNNETRNPKQISIQRINNNIGHIKINCVFSCLSCNCKRQENNHDETHYVEILSKMETLST